MYSTAVTVCVENLSGTDHTLGSLVGIPWLLNGEKSLMLYVQRVNWPTAIWCRADNVAFSKLISSITSRFGSCNPDTRQGKLRTQAEFKGRPKLVLFAIHQCISYAFN